MSASRRQILAFVERFRTGILMTELRRGAQQCGIVCYNMTIRPQKQAFGSDCRGQETVEEGVWNFGGGEKTEQSRSTGSFRHHFQRGMKDCFARGRKIRSTRIFLTD